MDARLSDAVFSTPAAPTLGGPGPLAPVPAQPKPRTARVRVTSEVVGVRGALGGYYRSLPPWIDDLTHEFGPDLYERMQLDDQVSSSLRALCHGVLSDDLVLRPGVDDDKDPDFTAAKDSLSFCERATWGQTGGLDQWLFTMLKGAVGGGNRVSETVYRPEESGKDAGKWVLDRLKVKPRRSIAFAVDSCNNLSGFLGLPPGGAGWGGLAWGTAFDPADPPDNFLPRDKFCALAWDPHDEDPRGSAILRCVYEPWWAKLQAAREWLAYLAQFGSPGLVGTTAPGADSSAPTDISGNPVPGDVLTPEQDMANKVMEHRNGGVHILPAGATLDVLQTSNAGDAFLKKVDSSDRAIAQGINLAMRAVMQSRFGSRADAEQGQDVAGLQTRFMKRWLARMVTEDLLRPLVRINYGPEAARRLCPYASLSPVEHQDLGASLVAVSGAWKNGLIKNSQLPWVYEQFGMPPATEEELAAPPPGSVPPGSVPPGAPGGPDDGSGDAQHPLAQALLAQGPPGGGSAPFAFDPAEPREPAGSAGGGRWASGGGAGDAAALRREARGRAAVARHALSAGLRSVDTGRLGDSARSAVLDAYAHAARPENRDGYRGDETAALAEKGAAALERSGWLPGASAAAGHFRGAAGHARAAAEGHRRADLAADAAREGRRLERRAAAKPQRQALRKARAAAAELLPGPNTAANDLAFGFDPGEGEALLAPTRAALSAFEAGWGAGDVPGSLAAAAAVRKAAAGLSAALGGAPGHAADRDTARALALNAGDVITHLTAYAAASGSASFAWDEGKHPRGQPENAGQFGPGGGGKAAEKDKGGKADASDPASWPVDWQRHVDRDRGRGDHVASWTYRDGADAYEQNVYVVSGTYDPDPENPDSEPVDVWRWESRDETSGTTDTGDWTHDEGEAVKGGKRFARESDQEEEHGTEDGPDEGEMLARAETLRGDTSEEETAALVGLPDVPYNKQDWGETRKYKPHYSGEPEHDAWGWEVNFQHPDLKTCKRFFGIDAAGDRFIRNEELVVKPDKRKGGVGSKIFAAQVEAASAAGYSYLQCHAAGDKDSNYKGYYVWPLFGYDEALDSVEETNPSLARKVRAEYPDAESILDVLEQPGGVDWWRENGDDLYDARFDLAEGSRSRRVLAAYLAEKGRKGS